MAPAADTHRIRDVSSVLVTGADGFIGRHCLPALREAGYLVHAVSRRRSRGDGDDGVRWHQADLLDLADVRRVVAEAAATHLLHLAWYTEHRQCWSSDENIRWLQASLELVRAFVATGGKRLVGTGSCAEYQLSYGYCSEAVTPLNPDSMYGMTKGALQRIVQKYAANHDISAAWGRVFYTYGPYEHPARLVPSVINSLLDGKEAECTHGNQIRDYLYVEDVAAALTALLDSRLDGPVNIGSGEPLRLKEIVNMIGDMTLRKDLIKLGARPAPEDEPPLIVADTRRLRESLGWEPGTSLRDGLQRTIEWWRARLPG